MIAIDLTWGIPLAKKQLPMVLDAIEELRQHLPEGSEVSGEVYPEPQKTFANLTVSVAGVEVRLAGTVPWSYVKVEALPPEWLERPSVEELGQVVAAGLRAAATKELQYLEAERERLAQLV